jgi:hypothetical protein
MTQDDELLRREDECATCHHARHAHIPAHGELRATCVGEAHPVGGAPIEVCRCDAFREPDPTPG